MPDRLLALREDLLRAGLAPRHVERYLAELSDHRADIAENLHAAGLAPEAARAEAERRLGAHDALLLPMLADRRFRSPAARWPALFYLLLPLAIQAAIVLTGILALLLAAATNLRPVIADLGDILALVLLAAPIVLAWLILVAAHRRRAGLHWPLLGIAAGILLAAALRLHVAAPMPGAAGQIGLTLGLPAPLPLLVLALVSLLPLSLHRRLE